MWDEEQRAGWEGQAERVNTRTLENKTETSSSTLTEGSELVQRRANRGGVCFLETPPAGSLGSRSGTCEGKPTLVQTGLFSKPRQLEKSGENAPKRWESTDGFLPRTWGHAPADAWFLCFGADLCQGQWGQKRRGVKGGLPPPFPPGLRLPVPS